jgi:hypothetical protein
VVDKGSGAGWVTVTGRGQDSVTEVTGPAVTGAEDDYKMLEILDGQSCMLYGCPTVLFVRMIKS